MENLNLDLGIPVTGEQWEQLGRVAAAKGGPQHGFAWQEGEAEQIRVYLRAKDASGLWQRFVSNPETYGTSELEAARFVFNAGRPYARIESRPAADEPSVTAGEEEKMQSELEHWVREQWQQLMRESGLHYERGHIPQG